MLICWSPISTTERSEHKVQSCKNSLGRIHSMIIFYELLAVSGNPIKKELNPWMTLTAMLVLYHSAEGNAPRWVFFSRHKVVSLGSSSLSKPLQSQHCPGLFPAVLLCMAQLVDVPPKVTSDDNYREYHRCSCPMRRKSYSVHFCVDTAH